MRAHAAHDHKYSYHLEQYGGMYTLMKMWCPLPDHGEYLQVPNNHLFNKAGCPICGHADTGKASTKTDAEFREDANKKHNHKYTYLDPYVSAKEKVRIWCPCPGHGVFRQTPASHTGPQRSGCPKCGRENTQWHLNGKLKKFITQHPDAMAILYAVKMSDGVLEWIKVGIAVIKKGKTAADAFRRRYGRNYAQVQIGQPHFLTLPADEAVQLEKTFKNPNGEWADERMTTLTKEQMPDGRTECFVMTALLDIHETLDDYLDPMAGVVY